jgi:hypothetical protein
MLSLSLIIALGGKLTLSAQVHQAVSEKAQAAPLVLQAALAARMLTAFVVRHLSPHLSR